MSFRRKPLHERLAREGGLVEPPPHHPGPHWGEVGIHGIARPREFDAAVVADAPDVRGDEATFVALPDGSLLVDDDVGDLRPLADALERVLEPPYSARAVRREKDRWAVAATAIEVVELATDPGGDAVELVVQGEERTLRVDGAHAFGRLRELEELATRRGHDAVVVNAERLDGSLWSVRVAPL